MSTPLASRRISQRYIGRPAKKQIIKAVGGNIIASSGSFRYHIFTSTGNFQLNWYHPDYSSEPIYYAVVGAGAGGTNGIDGSTTDGSGGDGGNGGGGGTMVSGSITAIALKFSYNCSAVVGSGGALGVNGTESYFVTGSGTLGFTFSKKTGAGGTVISSTAVTGGTGGYYPDGEGGNGDMAPGDYVNSLFDMAFNTRYGVGALTEHYGLGGFGGGGGGSGGPSDGAAGGTGQFQVYSADGAMGGDGGKGSDACSNVANGSNATSPSINTGHGGGGGGGGGGLTPGCGGAAGSGGSGTAGASGIIVLFYRFEV